jgi:hypothetical protein
VWSSKTLISYHNRTWHGITSQKTSTWIKVHIFWNLCPRSEYFGNVQFFISHLFLSELQTAHICVLDCGSGMCIQHTSLVGTPPVIFILLRNTK